jgi:hypothetical protein
VRKLPSGRWQARILMSGKPVPARSYAGKADAGAAPRGPRTVRRRHLGQPARMAFGTYADEWLSGRRDMAIRSSHDYEDLLRLHLKPAFGSPSARGHLRRGDVSEAGCRTGSSPRAAGVTDPDMA